MTHPVKPIMPRIFAILYITFTHLYNPSTYLSVKPEVE